MSTGLISENHWRLATFSQRMTTADWRKVLLAEADKIIYRGSVVRLVAKSIGHGVVEVTKEEEDGR